MPPQRTWIKSLSCLAVADAVLQALRATMTLEGLRSLMVDVTREMGFRYYALAHHDDLRIVRPGRVAILDYPAGILERLFAHENCRRDPVIRGCLYAGGAFLWSELSALFPFDRHDRASLELGMCEGLNEGCL